MFISRYQIALVVTFVAYASYSIFNDAAQVSDSKENNALHIYNDESIGISNQRISFTFFEKIKSLLGYKESDSIKGDGYDVSFQNEEGGEYFSSINSVDKRDGGEDQNSEKKYPIPVNLPEIPPEENEVVAANEETDQKNDFESAALDETNSEDDKFVEEALPGNKEEEVVDLEKQNNPIPMHPIER